MATYSIRDFDWLGLNVTMMVSEVTTEGKFYATGLGSSAAGAVACL